ncbi:flagellar basal body rod protein FlgC [Undibacterium sp. Ji49W]|uniref:flagellar basal body rod protein FlgC n=1 Tax=Undibacterium sp. Ji49W TaxID=3413040 RepID=UPI003BF1CA78
MDYRQSFGISAVGMSYERARVDVSAMNLANANTVREADGKGYQPMRVVARSALPNTDFSELMDNAGVFALGNAGRNFSIESIDKPARLVLEPGHPYADAKGFVSYPAVDSATEMMTLMSAMRAYEANVAAMNTARNMALKALEIGGGN